MAALQSHYHTVGNPFDQCESWSQDLAVCSLTSCSIPSASDSYTAPQKLHSHIISASSFPVNSSKRRAKYATLSWELHIASKILQGSLMTLPPLRSRMYIWCLYRFTMRENRSCKWQVTWFDSHWTAVKSSREATSNCFCVILVTRKLSDALLLLKPEAKRRVSNQKATYTNFR